MGRKKKNKFYAYDIGGTQGIVDSWAVCEQRVSGRPARYRGFPNRAAAEAWLAGGARYEEKAEKKQVFLDDLPQDAVFFDAGTGSGRGTEVKVVLRDCVPISHLADDSEGTLTKEGTLLLPPGKTNNYGELLGCYIALQGAAKVGSKHIYGDSRLVLDYWSKDHVKKDKRIADPPLSSLANKTARLRRAFEDQGGLLAHISGGINPADLGYHRD